MISEEIVVTIDTGSKFLKILVAQPSEKDANQFDIIFYYCQPTHTKKSTSEQIRQAITSIEKEIKTSLKNSFYIFGVPNDLLNWKTSSLQMAIDDGYVKNFHLIKAKKHFLENDNELNRFTTYKNCIIDNNHSVPNPIGVNTSELKLEAFIGSWKNQETCNQFEKTVKIINKERIFIYPNILTLPYNYLQEDDKDGSLLLDLGANQINFLFFRFGLTGALGSYPIGIETIITDLATGFNIPTSTARDILEKDLEKIQKNPTAFYKAKERYLPHSSIIKIIELRLEEICHSIQKSIIKEDNNFLYNKVILTGGGANISTLEKTIEKNFNKTTYQTHILESSNEKNKLSYTTTFGLLSYFIHFVKEKPEQDNSKKIFTKIRQFFIDD